MDSDAISVTLSIIATTLAVASFCGTIWRIWRDRPRLNFYVRRTIIHNQADDRKFDMVQIKASNIGFRSIILTRCFALGERSAFIMGIHDEPAAAYGIDDQRFPAIVEPGMTLTFHPITIGALERNATDPNDPKVHFDPYKYFVIEDSFGRFHHLRMKDIRWELQLDKKCVPSSWCEKIVEFFQRKALFWRAKRNQLKF